MLHEGHALGMHTISPSHPSHSIVGAAMGGPQGVNQMQNFNRQQQAAGGRQRSAIESIEMQDHMRALPVCACVYVYVCV